jgi:arylsulfatase A-like enzyme
MRWHEPDYQLVDGFRSYGQNLRDATGLYGGSIPLLSRINQGRIVPTSQERDHLRHLYSAEISFVDAQVGQVLEKIEDLDIWKNTMIILNADHGEAFGEHGKYYHGHNLYEGQIRVPLIVKPPASVPAGRIVAGPVRNLDIMATILDYCGIAVPQGCNGRSLRPAVEGRQDPQWPTCLETNSVQPPRHLMGYRDGRHKLIYDLTGGGSELFDLAADPGEQRDLLSLGQGQAVASQLGEEFLAALGAKALADLALKGETEQLDPVTKERLRALGYID